MSYIFARLLARLPALAKAKPGALNDSSAGNGSQAHFVGEQEPVASGRSR